MQHPYLWPANGVAGGLADLDPKPWTLQVNSLSNILTSGLQAEWLAGLLTGRVHLPTASEQCRDVERQRKWKQEVGTHVWGQTP